MLLERGGGRGGRGVEGCQNGEKQLIFRSYDGVHSQRSRKAISIPREPMASEGRTIARPSKTPIDAREHIGLVPEIHSAGTAIHVSCF